MLYTDIIVSILCFFKLHDVGHFKFYMLNVICSGATNFKCTVLYIRRLHCLDIIQLEK